MTRRGALLVAFVVIAAPSRGEESPNAGARLVGPSRALPRLRSGSLRGGRRLPQSRGSGALGGREQIRGLPTRVESAFRSSSCPRSLRRGASRRRRWESFSCPTEASRTRSFSSIARILRNLGFGTKGDSMLSPSERRDVARALGRVVVHEVIHALAPTLSHSDEGLMHDALLAGALSKRRSRSRRAHSERVPLGPRGHG